jgi:hypothetical protein
LIVPSGKWDAMFVWDLEGGLTDLQWFRSADELKWFAALAELQAQMPTASNAVMKAFNIDPPRLCLLHPA